MNGYFMAGYRLLRGIPAGWDAELAGELYGISADEAMQNVEDDRFYYADDPHDGERFYVDMNDSSFSSYSVSKDDLIASFVAWDDESARIGIRVWEVLGNDSEGQ